MTHACPVYISKTRNNLLIQTLLQIKVSIVSGNSPNFNRLQYKVGLVHVSWVHQEIIGETKMQTLIENVSGALHTFIGLASDAVKICTHFEKCLFEMLAEAKTCVVFNRISLFM